MVSSGANPLHQLFGTPGSHTGSTDIHQGKVRHHNSSQDRQHIRGGLHQQNGGGTVSTTLSRLTKDLYMVMVYGKEYPVTSTALSRSIEFHCRQGVKDLVRQSFPQPSFKRSIISWDHFQQTCLQAGCQLSCQPLSAGNQIRWQ